MLILNTSNNEKFPRHFRQDTSLQVIGSAAPCETALIAATRIVGKAALDLLDLRSEVHFLLNGDAVSVYGEKDWGTKGMTESEIRKMELAWIRDLQDRGYADVHTVTAKSIEGEIIESTAVRTSLTSLFTVEETAARLLIPYKRIFVIDHLVPSEEQVTDFLAWYKARDPSRWTYVFCAGGKGRTTTFMAMFDILRNGKTDSLDTILQRQHKLGGSNLASFESKKPYMVPLKKDRLAFLQKFYEDQS